MKKNYVSPFTKAHTLTESLSLLAASPCGNVNTNPSVNPNKEEDEDLDFMNSGSPTMTIT